jgi:predicted GNAT family acetyltransferase
MEIKQQQQGDKGRFITADELGEITYGLESKDVVTIYHTDVDEALKGKGAGKQLVNAVVGWAREQGYRIHPLCPFAKAVLERDERYSDVLLKEKI